MLGIVAISISFSTNIAALFSSFSVSIDGIASVGVAATEVACPTFAVVVVVVAISDEFVLLFVNWLLDEPEVGAGVEVPVDAFSEDEALLVF